MSDVIEFIERLGQDAHLHQLRSEQLEQAMIAADLDPAARAALLSEDARRLEALLHAPTNLCCLIVESEGDEPEGAGDTAT